MEGLMLIAAVVGAALLWRFWTNAPEPEPAAPAPVVPALTEGQRIQIEQWKQFCTDNCELPRMICGPVPGGFDNNEQVLAVFPVIALKEPRAIRYSRSRYAGHSVRVMKGWSVRTGEGGGQSESVEELREIDVGTLVLTSKRLAFIGMVRTNSCGLDDLIAIETY